MSLSFLIFLNVGFPDNLLSSMMYLLLPSNLSSSGSSSASTQDWSGTTGIIVYDQLNNGVLPHPTSHVLWAEIGEIWLIGSELVQETTNKVVLIKEKLKAARDCQKSYVGNLRKHLELKLVIK
ncbi:hypothetical protein Tco_0655488 [Tanacetum coccineum]|uniref:Uncharacterized protein n=1 Tax=Tanacetum coccineum TaxID=301880 RepID=A0ABQ4X654_9ASTR